MPKIWKKSYKCKECGRVFGSKIALLGHEKTHNKGKAAEAGKPKKAAKVVETGKDMVLETPIEGMIALLKEKKTVSLQALSKELGWSVDTIERIGKVFEKRGIVDVQYPTVFTQKPRIKFLKELTGEEHPHVKGRTLKSQVFTVDNVPAKARIIKPVHEHRHSYDLSIPHVGPYTRVFLEELKESIAEKVPVEIAEITDEKKSRKLKERFFKSALAEIEKYMGTQNPKSNSILAGMLLHSMYGLGIIEILMADNELEEVAINSAKSPVTVYHKDLGWMKTNITMASEAEIANYSAQIARKVGREITNLSPILDAHLITGDRVNASLSPISSFGNTITIRRFARRPWTIIDFIGASHTMNVEMASLLWLAMQYEMSILLAGGTASGKTSTLNSLCAFMPSYHRVISIEDVREIMLPQHLRWNWVPTTTRNPNPEGLGEVTMLQLMQASLRMRPDRIILGEVRRQREAEVLFEAMHTGHSVYSTLHANSSQQVLRRLIEPPISLPPLEIEGLDLIVVQYRDRKTNRRRTYEISEIESGTRDENLSVNTIFKWSPRTDKWETLNPAVKLMGNLNLHTGMTEKEIIMDLEDRAAILKWMLKRNLSDIGSVGSVMTQYYSDPKKVTLAAKKNAEPKTVVGAG